MILRVTLKHLLRNPMSSVFTLFAICAALTLLGSFWAMVENLERVKTPTVASNEGGILSGLSVFVSPSLSESEVSALKAKILEDKRFKSLDVVSSEESLRSLEAQFGETLTKVFEGEKLPLAFKLQFASGSITRDSLLELLNSLRAMPGVLEVDDGLSVLPSQASSISSKVFSWATGLLILVFLVVALLVSHIIRMAYEPLRGELETLQILGAAKSWIFLPILLEGFIFGIVGSLSAIGILGILIKVVLPEYAAALLPKGLEVFTLSLNSSLGLLIVGLASSLVGAAFTWPLVNRSSIEVR